MTSQLQTTAFYRYVAPESWDKFSFLVVVKLFSTAYIFLFFLLYLFIILSFRYLRFILF